MKKIVTVWICIAMILITAFVMLSENNNEKRVLIGNSTRANANWTFMVYLDGDCDLEKFAISDMNEMEEIGSSDEVNIIVLIDRWDGYQNEEYKPSINSEGKEEPQGDDTSNGNWTDSRIYYIEQDNDEYNITTSFTDNGEVNMGDPQTLIDFVNYTMTNFPGDNYALILWDHGMGWPGVCPDSYSDDDALDMTELDYALNEITNDYGSKLDIVGFDACLMGMLEVDYQIKDYASYRVGSEETEPGDGLLYKDFLKDLVANSSMTPIELASLMTDSFVNSYTDGEPNPDDVQEITQSTIDLEKINTLAENVSVFALNLINAIDDDEGYNILRARYDCEEYGKSLYPYTDPGSEFIDLYHFAQLIKEYIDNSTIDQCADDVMTAINNTVVKEGHGYERPNSHGIAIYFPENRNAIAPEGSYSDYYADISFSKTYYWIDFLNALYNDMLPNNPPVIDTIVPNPNDYVIMNENDSKTFSITAYDPENEDLTYEWYSADVSPTSESIIEPYKPLYNLSGYIEIDGSELTLTSTYDMGGKYYAIKVDVIDVEGYKNTTKWIVKIIDVNRNPVINSTTPTSLSVSINESESQTFSITAYDPDGEELTYQWYIDDIAVNDTTNGITINDNTLIFSSEYGGTTHTIYANISDGNGGYVETEKWTINIGGESTEQPQFIYEILLSIIIIIIVIVVALAFVIMRKKKGKGKQPVKEEPPTEEILAYECPECGTQIKEKVNKCPNCEAEFEE